MTKFARSILFGTTTVAASMMLAPVSAIAQERNFDVPAQSAVTGIPELARQADVQILVSESAVRGKRTKAVKGRYTARHALELLLERTGIEISSNKNSTFTLAPSREAGNVPNSASSSGEEEASNTDIVVTGTRLGQSNQASPLTVVSRDSARESGASTVAEVLQRIPQNFTGDIQAESSNVGQQGGIGSKFYNRGRSSSVNLRGLGSSATLAVMNGRFLPPGSEGVAPDISMIPLLALERIDVLRDGASPIYGADAVAGVVNFITRKKVDVLETTFRYGGVTDGNYRQLQVGQAVGHNWGRVSAFLSYQYDKQDPLFNTEREATQNVAAVSVKNIFPDEKQHSAYGNIYFDVTDSFEIYSEAIFSRRTDYQETQNAFYAPDIGISAESKNTQYVGSLNFRKNFDDNWSLTGSVQKSQNKLDYLVHRIPSNQSLGEQNWKRKSTSVNLSATGTLLNLPGGEVRLAIGGDYRREHGELVGQYDFSRTVKAAFAEIEVPLVGPDQDLPIARRIALTGAVRYDNYSDFGSTTNPKLGLVWEVNRSIRFRGTYSTAFRAPSFFDRSPGNGYGAVIYLPDPNNGGRSLALFAAALPKGSLSPETSRNLTFGMDLTPVAISGFSAHIDYYDIKFKNRIAAPESAVANILNLSDPAVEKFLIRNPGADLTAPIFALPIFANYTGGPVSPADVQVFIDDRTTNLGSLEARGIDLSMNYHAPMADGEAHIGLDGTFGIDFKVSAAPGLPLTEFLGNTYFPPKYRLRFNLGWENERFTGNVFMDYRPPHSDHRFAEAATVKSYTTADARVAYRFPKSAGPLNGLEIGLTANNLFDEKPPYVRPATTNAWPSYDPTNSSILGRVIAIDLRKKW